MIYCCHEMCCDKKSMAVQEQNIYVCFALLRGSGGALVAGFAWSRLYVISCSSRVSFDFVPANRRSASWLNKLCILSPPCSPRIPGPTCHFFTKGIRWSSR